MTASGFPTLAGVLIPSVRGGSQVLIVGKRNVVRVSNRAEGSSASMNSTLRPVKMGREARSYLPAAAPAFAPARICARTKAPLAESSSGGQIA